MNVGDVYRGSRGGRREVEGYEWSAEEEAQYRAEGAPCPEAGRVVLVLVGEDRWPRRRMWPDHMGWFGTATLTTAGDGAAPPWGLTEAPDIE